MTEIKSLTQGAAGTPTPRRYRKGPRLKPIIRDLTAALCGTATDGRPAVLCVTALAAFLENKASTQGSLHFILDSDSNPQVSGEKVIRTFTIWL